MDFPQLQSRFQRSSDPFWKLQWRIWFLDFFEFLEVFHLHCIMVSFLHLQKEQWLTISFSCYLVSGSLTSTCEAPPLCRIYDVTLWPLCIIQYNFSISRSRFLIRSPKFLFLCKITYSQILWMRSWIALWAIILPNIGKIPNVLLYRNTSPQMQI